MANENFGSTVLYEHRRVVTLRHLLALVNFIAIFASTFVTRYFVLIRGTSDGILLIINSLCVVNILQILLCIFDYVTKVMLGRYYPKMVRISYLVGVIWVGMVVAEFVSGTLTLGDIRIDLAVIAVFQFISAIIAYLIWPHIDYATIKNMTHKNARDNASKRSKKATAGAIKYVIVCLLMVAVQFGLLFAYQLPPKVYDLFSESRQLQYALSDDGQSYEVSGVYQGTSSFVNIPATYNNKPVTKIRSGAISNESVLEKYKIDKIEFGSIVTDSEGNQSLVSNVQIIERGAINNDKITTLTIPSSVTRIENGAIKSSSLKNIIYEARAQFSYPYLECESLTTITFSGLEAGKIISLEGMDPSITLEVPKETYNNYREKNGEYMASIRPILESGEFVVDFYTDSDYYIESIFAVSGEVVEIGCDDLKNDKYDDRIAPSVDTLAYIEDSKEIGTMGCKENSAFRGWYFDRNFTNECDFADGNIVVSKDTAIYAKWIDEYTGKLIWGENTTYRPDGCPDTIYWTDDNTKVLPVITNREGYDAGIAWSVGGQTVASTQEIIDSYIKGNPDVTCENVINIQGNWMLNNPTIDINPYPQKSDDLTYVVSPDKNTVTFTYDETQEINLDGIMSHDFDGTDGFVYSTEWYKEGGTGSVINPNATHKVKNVTESGTYILKVIATSPWGDQSYSETRISVQIVKKDLNIGEYELNNKTTVYNANKQTLTDNSVPVDSSIGVSFEYYDEKDNFISTNGVKDAGTYKVVVIFAKTNAEEAKNYNTKELSAIMVITPQPLTFNSWSADEFVYNASDRTVTLNVDGKYSGDVVNIIYKEGSNVAKNVGTYTAEAIGVDNKNYTIIGMENTSHAWEITPKEVTILRWTLDGAITNDYTIVYNGEEHSIAAIPEGVFASDKEYIQFIYDESANTVAATNANKYVAKIIGINSDNYVLSESSVATQEWEIEKKIISVGLENSSFTYNGSVHVVNAILSGIVASDLDSFAYEKFAYEGKSAGLGVSGKKDGDNYVISFSAKDAAEYTAQISGIINSADINLNYAISTSSATLTIVPKLITITQPNEYTYTGEMQTLSVVVNGIENEDIESVSYSQFTSNILTNGRRDGENYLLTMNAKDAKEYLYTVESFSNSNYTLSRTEGILKIEKKRLSIEWEITNNADGVKSGITAGSSVVYNAVGYTIGANITGLVKDEVVNLTFEDNTGLNAESYNTVASLPDSYTNYVFDSQTLSWSITPYVVDFKWTFNGVEYSVSGGNVPEFVYNANVVEVVPVYNLLGTDTINITYASGKGDISKRDASTETYKVAIAEFDSNNYSIGANSSFEWKINPKSVNVTWTHASDITTYNGQYQGPKFTLDGVVENDLRVKVFAGTESNSAYMDITSVDVTKEYDYKTTELIINAKESGYSCAVLGIYTNSGSKSNNYVIVGEAVNYVVNKAPLTLAGWQYTSGGVVTSYTSESALVYNAKAYTMTNTINESMFVRDGITDNVYLVYTNNSVKNAGNHNTKVQLAGTHKDNYVITDTTELNWSILQKEIEVVWDTNSFVYDKSYHTQSATAVFGAMTDDDGKVYDGDSINLGYSNNHKRDAGTYTATIGSIGNNNYKLKSDVVSYEWTIAQMEVLYSDLVWNTDEFTYNGNNQYPEAHYTAGGTRLSVKYNKSENSKDANLGSSKYTIYATEFENANYVLVGENDGHEYVINPVVVNFTWGFDESESNADSYEYDGSEKTVNAYVANICIGDVINLTYNKENRKISDAGTYTFTVTGIDNTNYVLNIDSQMVSKTLTVSPRNIEISWGYNEEKSGADDFIYDGKARVISAHVSNLCEGDEEFTLLYSVDTQRNVVNVGEYRFTVEAGTYGNYIIRDAISETVVVSPQEINIEWVGDDDVVYDGNSHSLVAVLTGTINDETIEIYPNYSGSTSHVNAGVYDIYVISYGSYASGFRSSNFVLPNNTYNQLYINKQTLKVTWNGSRDVTYDGNYHVLDAILEGQIGGRTVFATPVYESDLHSAISAGTHTFEVTDATSSDPTMNIDNFALHYDSSLKATLTIQKYEVQVIWNDAADIEFTYNGEAHSLSATVLGVNDTNIDFKYSGNGKTAAGSYTVGISLVDTTNYKLPSTGTTKVLKINKQSVKIDWSGDGDITYDGSSHTPIAVVTGKIDGKTVGYNKTGSSATNVGNYNYSITLADSNYTLDGCDGSATAYISIKPQPVVVTWSGSKNVVYDGSGHRLVASVVGMIDGKTISFKPNSTSYNSNVGNYEYYVTLSNANYTLEGVEGASATLVITPQPVDITWSGSTSVVYDGVEHTLTAKVVGRNSRSSVPFTYVTDGKRTNVGIGTCTIALESGNYMIDAESGATSKSFEITAQPVNITWNGATSVVYDGKTHGLTASVVGRETGAVVDFIYTSGSRIMEVGKMSYSIALSNSNYTIDGLSGSTSNTITIVPQEVIISWSGNETYVYTGQTYLMTYTVVGKNNGEDVTSDCYGTGVTSFKNAGTYNYTITGISNKNYTLENCTGELIATATVSPMEITIEWVGDTVVVHDGNVHSIEAIVKDKYGNKINVGYKDGNTVTSVGTKTVIINFGTLEANYIVVSGEKRQTITVVEEAE